MYSIVLYAQIESLYRLQRYNSGKNKKTKSREIKMDLFGETRICIYLFISGK